MLTKFLKTFLVLFFLITMVSCLGVGTRIKPEETFIPISYDKAFDISLKSANQMIQECKIINPYNFPIIVDIGTSKSRGVITLHYRYDPVAGNICSQPPEPIKVLGKGFIPHFGAEYYMHIRFIKKGDIAEGVKIEITQMKGIKKQEFVDEMERLKETYLKYLRRNWQ